MTSRTITRGMAACINACINVHPSIYPSTPLYSQQPLHIKFTLSVCTAGPKELQFQMCCLGEQKKC